MSLPVAPFGSCPLCTASLSGRAQLPSAAGGVNRAFMCPKCGFFLVPGELSVAFAGLDLARRGRLAAVVRAARVRPHVVTSDELAPVRSRPA